MIKKLLKDEDRNGHYRYFDIEFGDKINEIIDVVNKLEER